MALDLIGNATVPSPARALTVGSLTNPTYAGPFLVVGAFEPLYVAGTKGGMLTPNGIFTNAAGTAWYVVAMADWNSSIPDLLNFGASNQNGSVSSVGMWKSTDLGRTWAQMDSASRPQLARLSNAGVFTLVTPNAGDGRFFACARHPSAEQVWVVYQGVGTATTGPLQAQVFDMTTNTWGAVLDSGVTLDSESVAGAQIFPLQQTLGCAFSTTTGALSIVYRQPVPLDPMNPSPLIGRCYYTTLLAGVWLASVPIPNTEDWLGVGNNPTTFLNGICSGAGGRVHTVFSVYGIPVLDVPVPPGGRTSYDDTHYWLAADGAGGSGAATDIILSVTGDGFSLNPGVLEGITAAPYLYYAASPGDLIFLGDTSFGGGGLVTMYGSESATPVWSNSADTSGLNANFNNVCSMVTDSGSSITLIMDGPNTGVDGYTWLGAGVWSVPVPWFGGLDPSTTAPFAIMSYLLNSIGATFGFSNGTGFPIAYGDQVGMPVGVFGGAAPFVGGIIGVGGFVPSGAAVLPGGVVILGVAPAGPIVGNAVFGGPQVFTPGKVNKINLAGVGGGGIGGGGSPAHWPGWPVWPPVWQQENEYDRCLNRFRLRARNVCLADQSRCIVWHDMDELGRMPDGAVEFYERGSIITPAPMPVPTTIMQFVVPTGYLGIIYGVLLHYTGTGFEEGSGDIIWRVMVGNAWAAPGLGNCLFSLGTVGQCLSLTDYIAANSNQRISVGVQVPNTSGFIQAGASRILATLQGWYYPI